jgi:hypothetical protein
MTKGKYTAMVEVVSPLEFRKMQMLNKITLIEELKIDLALLYS